MSRRKSPPAVPHKPLTLPELCTKLPDLRQQMAELLEVAEQAGGEQLRDLTDCVMGFDDLIESVSLQIDLFDRRLRKLRQQMEGGQQ